MWAAVETGPEIVFFFGDACKRLRVVPASGTETTALWLGRPRDSLGFGVRAKVKQAATRLKAKEADLIRWIGDETVDEHFSEQQLVLLERFFK